MNPLKKLLARLFPPRLVCPECQWEIHLLNQWRQQSLLIRWQDWLVERMFLKKNHSVAMSEEKPVLTVSSQARPKPWTLIAALMLPGSVRRGLKKSSTRHPLRCRPALRRWWIQWRTQLLRRLFLWLVTQLIRFWRGRLTISASARLKLLNSSKPGELKNTPSVPTKENYLVRWLKRLRRALPSRPVVKNLCPRHRL